MKIKLLVVGFTLCLVGLVIVGGFSIINVYSEIDTIHPCQQVGIDHINLYTLSPQKFYTMTEKEHIQFGEEYTLKIKDLQQITLQNNCLKMDPIWFTEEYKQTLNALIEK